MGAGFEQFGDAQPQMNAHSGVPESPNPHRRAGNPWNRSRTKPEVVTYPSPGAETGHPIVEGES
jgi:hypothetical protein